MYVHGQNLEQKENQKTKYRDTESRRYLTEIRAKYNEWNLANEQLIGPLTETTNQDSELLIKRVELLNEYKYFLEQKHYAEKFYSRSNLHSSVLEEFMYYLFKDLVSEFSSQALIGKYRTFKDIFFRSENYRDMLSYPLHRLVDIFPTIKSENSEVNFTYCTETRTESTHNITILQQLIKQIPIQQK